MGESSRAATRGAASPSRPPARVGFPDPAYTAVRRQLTALSGESETMMGLGSGRGSGRQHHGHAPGPRRAGRSRRSSILPRATPTRRSQRRRETLAADEEEEDEEPARGARTRSARIPTITDMGVVGTRRGAHGHHVAGALQRPGQRTSRNGSSRRARSFAAASGWWRSSAKAAWGRCGKARTC